MRARAASWVRLFSSRTVDLGRRGGATTDLAWPWLSERTSRRPRAPGPTPPSDSAEIVLQHRQLAKSTLVPQSHGSARVATRQNPGPV
jgi:hypothetical protein